MSRPGRSLHKPRVLDNFSPSRRWRTNFVIYPPETDRRLCQETPWMYVLEEKTRIIVLQALNERTHTSSFEPAQSIEHAVELLWSRCDIERLVGGKVQVWPSTTCCATVYPYSLNNPNISMPWSRMHSPKNCDTMRYRPRCLRVCKCELQIPFANAKGNRVENGSKKYSLSPSCWEESFFLESLYERRSCNSSRDSSLHWAESAGTKAMGRTDTAGFSMQLWDIFLVCRQKNSYAQVIAMKIPTRHKFPQLGCKLGPRLPTMEFHFHLHYLHWSWLWLLAAQKSMGYKRSESWIWIDPVPSCIKCDIS